MAPSGCVPEGLMVTELAFRDAVWSNQSIEVETSGGTMWWEAGDETLRFTRRDEPPADSRGPFQTP